MKITKNDNGFEVSAKDFNHFYRFFIFNIFYDIPILIIIFIAFSEKEMMIICFIALLIGELIGFFSDRYYLVNLKVKGDFFEAIFSPNNKKVIFESKISNLDFKLTKFAAGTMSLRKRIIISEGKKRIFEIRPHNAVIYREYNEDDIEKIYNLLIEHQNKLKQQETTE